MITQPSESRRLQVVALTCSTDSSASSSALSPSCMASPQDGITFSAVTVKPGWLLSAVKRASPTVWPPVPPMSTASKNWPLTSRPSPASAPVKVVVVTSPERTTSAGRLEPGLTSSVNAFRIGFVSVFPQPTKPRFAGSKRCRSAKARRWALPAKDASDPCRMISRMVDEAVKSKRMKAPGRPSPPLPPWSRCGEYSSTICWPLATTSKPRVQHCGPTLCSDRFRTCR